MIDFKPKKGKEHKPIRVMLYGQSGLGKSTLASMFPDPVFIDIEDRLSHLDVTKMPLCKSYKSASDPQNNFAEQLGWVMKAEHDFKTLVIDTSDWLELLVLEHICGENNVQDVSDIGYGKGYDKAASVWQDIIFALTTIQNSRKMNIVFTSHCHTTKFSDPSGETWDMYSPKLNKKPNAMLIEWMDYVFFIRVKPVMKTVDEGFTKKTKANSKVSDIVLYSRKNPTYEAKRSSELIADEIARDDFINVIKLITNQTEAK